MSMHTIYYKVTPDAEPVPLELNDCVCGKVTSWLRTYGDTPLFRIECDGGHRQTSLYSSMDNAVRAWNNNKDFWERVV